MCEFDAYKAVYCGLCGQLGKSFGACARVTLSYDFTFLSMLHCSVTKNTAEFERRSCYVNPIKKQLTCRTSEELEFAADTAVIMLYYKLLDNMQDGGFFSKMGGGVVFPAVNAAYKKAELRRPECKKIIETAAINQNELERQKCDRVDEAAQPTADALAGICSLMSEDENTKRVLSRLGYFVGRYVYLCDALDDLEKDIKTGGYNPFAFRYKKEEIYTNAKESLYATIAECSKAYSLLDEGQFHPILLNVFEMGMKANVKEILSKKERQSDK